MAKVTKIDFHSSAFIEGKWRTMEWRTIFLQVKECKLTSNINVMVMPQVHSVESMQSLYNNWHELSQNAHSHNQNNLNSTCDSQPYYHPKASTPFDAEKHCKAYSKRITFYGTSRLICVINKVILPFQTGHMCSSITQWGTFIRHIPVNIAYSNNVGTPRVFTDVYGTVW